MPRLPPRRCRVSPGEEFHTVRLPKGWTPAKILRFADAVNAIGQAQRLGDEVRALRRERREMRKALKLALPQIGCCCMETMTRECPECRAATGATKKALAPKARRRKA